MDDFERISIKYTPAHINQTYISSEIDDNARIGDNTLSKDQLALAIKFEDHLIAIKEWKERVEAFEFLAENASKLAGNTSFETKKEDILVSISALGGNSNTVDFKLFKKAIDIIITGFEQQALASLTGVLGEQ